VRHDRKINISISEEKTFRRTIGSKINTNNSDEDVDVVQLVEIPTVGSFLGLNRAHFSKVDIR